MATHSSILAWRIPWTGEPGRLQSMASQRVERNWSDLAHMPYFWLINLHLLLFSHSVCLTLCDPILQTPWTVALCGEGSGTLLQYFCLENPMDGGAWWAAVHGVMKSWTRLSDFTFTFHFHALEKEMATHSSVLAWRIPGTREPGGLPSMGSHRVGHYWSNLAAAAAMCFLAVKTVYPDHFYW